MRRPIGTEKPCSNGRRKELSGRSNAASRFEGSSSQTQLRQSPVKFQTLQMSGSGQSRHFGRWPITSGLTLGADIVRAGRYVSKVPHPDIANLGPTISPRQPQAGPPFHSPASPSAQLAAYASLGKFIVRKWQMADRIGRAASHVDHEVGAQGGATPDWIKSLAASIPLRSSPVPRRRGSGRRRRI